MPLPPYITHKLKDKNRYQTVYAKMRDSAAAPTAGLHFTKELLEQVKAKGVNIAHVTLHVGLGTFRPVKEDEIEHHTMHSEHYTLPEETAQLMMKYPTIPCNDCKYCMPCPYALDIPGILLHYNKCVNEGNVPKSVQDENYAKARRAFLVGYDRSVPKLRQANHCTGCEQCNPHCPQGIDIPKEMQRIDKFVEELKVNG